MLEKKKQRYLVPKDKMLFLKEIAANSKVTAEYGWRNTGTLFKHHMLSYAIEFVKEILDQEKSTTGKVVRRIYGVERIPDIMLIKEMKAYVEGLNVDRLVSFAALVAFAQVQVSNMGYMKRTVNRDLDKEKELYKLRKSPFSNKGAHAQLKKRSPFKNIR